MHLPATLALFALLLAPAAHAADAACGPLKKLDSIPLRQIPGGKNLIPVTVNGTKEYFLLDTGGYYTQIGKKLAADLNLPIRPGAFRLFDATGDVSHDLARADFTIGQMHGANIALPIAPLGGPDGIVALDHLSAMDVDLDFNSGTMSLFDPGHCPGNVVWWKAKNIATIPITLRGYHMIVPVMLDGHAQQALIDTGTAVTSLLRHEAEGMGLVMGAAGTPEDGHLNGNPALRTWTHTFQTLSFGGVTVSNPRIAIIPNAFGSNAGTASPAEERARSEKDALNVPGLILGMDVLSKLHLYFAFKERALYVSEAASPWVISIAFPPITMRARALTEITYLNSQLADRPDDPDLLGRRCFMRGLAKSELDDALKDCDRALQLRPGAITFLDDRALIFYLKGDYPAARQAYDQVLAINPAYPSSLLMRGLARGRLGDEAGLEADIAAAMAAQPNIVTRYQNFGILDQTRR